MNIDIKYPKKFTKAYDAILDHCIFDLNEMSIIHDELRKFCHAPKCKNFKSCPQRCRCQSNTKLDLDTAIAWTTADELAELNKRLSAVIRDLTRWKRGRSGPKILNIVLAEYCKCTDSFINSALHNRELLGLHHHKYRKLLRLIQRSSSCMPFRGLRHRTAKLTTTHQLRKYY